MMPAADPAPPRRRDWLLAGIALLIIVAVVLAAPGGLLDKADQVGYAVCHQIEVRSFFIGDRAMPLCARCTGQYLGAFFGLLVFLAVRRGRAGLFPPTTILILLVLFFLIWAFDGVNSYLTLFPGAPHLYEPRNILRVSTGMLQGIAVIALVLPLFNLTAWANPEPVPTIRNLRELAALMVMGAVLVLAVQSDFEALLLPLAVASALGTVVLLTLVMTVIALIVMQRSSTATHWSQLVVPLLWGLAGSLILIALIDAGRAALTAALGLPF
jgi:uncharacterized membrane protein